jgi:hypothetical protein
MILVSILAAFAIDNWREDNERARRLAEARSSLTQELRFNLQLLAEENYLPHHRRLQEIYRTMMASGTTDRADAIRRRCAMPPGAAFSSAVSPAICRSICMRASRESTSPRSGSISCTRPPSAR